jgi:cardiolipin synthase
MAQASPEPVRVVTVPNILSVARLCCAPLFVWLLFGRHDRLSASLLLGTLGATDWVDGYIARHFNQVSDLGKVLDPTADRILLVTAIVALIVDGSVPGWVAWLAIAREVLVSIAALVLAAAGARRIDVQWVGKAGTLAMMFAFPLFLLGAAGRGVSDGARALGWVFALPGLVLSYYAAATYVPIARAALKEGRAARVPEPAA